MFGWHLCVLLRRINVLKKYLVIPLLMVSTHAFAWFCPNNFNLIQAGDSLDKIKRECGKPLAETSSKQEPKTPQEWGYYVAVNPPNPATVKMSVVFSSGGLVNNITVNAMSLASTSLCGGTISVGDTIQAVKAACGAPPFVNKGQTAQGNDKPIVVNELTYGGPPPNTLVFESGMLTQRR
jgi:hypothetical protein